MADPNLDLHECFLSHAFPSSPPGVAKEAIDCSQLLVCHPTGAPIAAEARPENPRNSSDDTVPAHDSNCNFEEKPEVSSTTTPQQLPTAPTDRPQASKKPWVNFANKKFLANWELFVSPSSGCNFRKTDIYVTGQI